MLDNTIVAMMGRLDYEEDLRRQPYYVTGERRPTWDELPEHLQRTWWRFPFTREMEQYLTHAP